MASANGVTWIAPRAALRADRVSITQENVRGGSKGLTGHMHPRGAPIGGFAQIASLCMPGRSRTARCVRPCQILRPRWPRI